MESPSELAHPVNIYDAFQQIVDPRISQAKFEKEIDRFRESESLQRRRGIFLLRAEFPVVVLAFAAPQIPFAPVVFGARLDFTDYDNSPPSLRLINPFTEEVYPSDKAPTALLRRVVSSDGRVTAQPLLQAHEGHFPFVCIQGVREYHEHPAHTGDSWYLYRGSGKGTLSDLADQLYLHGIAPLVLELKASASELRTRIAPLIQSLPGDPIPRASNISLSNDGIK